MKTGIKIGLLPLLIGLLCLVFCFPLLAAQRLAFSGTTSIEFNRDTTSGEKPDEEILKEQQAELKDCGLNLQIDSNGNVSLGQVFPGNQNEAVEYHNNLIEKGILSFMCYDEAVCSSLNQLVVVFDFSNYYIPTFGEYCFQSIHESIWGDQWWDNVSFTEDVAVYSATSGVYLETIEDVVFEKGCYTINQTTYDEYSLRLILPSVTDQTITFEDRSLNFAYVVVPEVLIIDVSNLSLSLEAGNLIFEEDVFSSYGDLRDGPDHLHFIGLEERQMEYILSFGMDMLLTDISVKNQFIIGIYSRARNSYSSRLFYTLRKESNGMSVDLFDENNEESIQSRLNILYLCYFLKHVYRQPMTSSGFENIVLYHMRNQTETEKGILSCNWNGAIIDEKTVYQVTCSHDSLTNIGYFADDRSFYVDGKWYAS